MRLSAFATHDATLPLNAFSNDGELVRDIQTQLSSAGLLDPEADGVFGPVTQWALNEVWSRMAKGPLIGLTPSVAKALLAPEVKELWPYRPVEDLPSTIAKAATSAGHWLSRHPKCFNIVYVEGMDPDGSANGNEPNQFNDSRFLLRFDMFGSPMLAGAWEATTEPGRFWTEHPMDRKGAARIAFGQYKSWIVGQHHPTKPGAHEALVQIGAVKVYRDTAKNYRREGRTYDGLFAINQHWGYNLPKGDLGQSSAGCLVGRTKEGHREFMRLVKSDPRFKANKGYRFMTIVLPSSALTKR